MTFGYFTEVFTVYESDVFVDCLMSVQVIHTYTVVARTAIANSYSCITLWYSCTLCIAVPAATHLNLMHFM